MITHGRELVAWICLIWCTAVAVVCALGYVQLYVWILTARSATRLTLA